VFQIGFVQLDPKVIEVSVGGQLVPSILPEKPSPNFNSRKVSGHSASIALSPKPPPTSNTASAGGHEIALSS